MQYGLWPSPIGPQSLAEGLRLSDVAWDSDGETLVWLEGRSDRGVLVCLPPGGDAPRDLTSELSVRARVGYGGGDFSVAGGSVYFVEADGRGQGSRCDVREELRGDPFRRCCSPISLDGLMFRLETAPKKSRIVSAVG